MSVSTTISNKSRQAQLAASKFVPKPVGRKIGRAAAQVQKNSPQVLFGAGVAGLVTTAVLASRATLKLDTVMNEHDELLEKVAQCPKQTDRETYSDQDMLKDKTIIKVKTVTQLAKLYALPAGVGILSVACFAGGQAVLSKRNASLVAAYAGLEKGFNEYRSRVISELGVDKDQHFRFESEKSSVNETDEQGNVTTKSATVASPFKDSSIYARFFDEYSNSWNPSAEYNRIFLQCQQQYANDMLRARGHLFLNEVYDMLGLERTKAGAVVGWVWGNGDNFVDFGIFDKGSDRIRDFVNGREASILLDFNVDGVIYDKI